MSKCRSEVTRMGMIDMQVCVPSEFSDAQVLQFANAENPSGIDGGWTIRREGDDALDGCPERQPCGENMGKVHIMLDA